MLNGHVYITLQIVITKSAVIIILTIIVMLIVMMMIHSVILDFSACFCNCVAPSDINKVRALNFFNLMLFITEQVLGIWVPPIRSQATGSWDKMSIEHKCPLKIE